MGLKEKAWVVAVEMGYGHMRAAGPLLSLAYRRKIILADNYEGIPKRDRLIWEKSAKIYYFFSRLSDKGALGNLVFRAFNYFQGIEDIDKKQIKPTFQLKQGYALIKSGWGRDLIENLNKESLQQARGKPIPLITTFFTIGHMAEHWGYKGEIYILVTDSDISRSWAPLEPKKSRINYFAPTERAAKHLKNYGVRTEKIHLTGFPLPPELLGKSLKTALQNFKNRYRRLNPQNGFREPLKIVFAIGGAGAQVKIGKKIVKSLASSAEEGKISLTVILGTHRQLISQFKNATPRGSAVNFFSCQTKEEYFSHFNEIISKTDVLWTKPSELSFYAGLGLPIIIAPPLGAQEEKNREWLLELGAGIDQGEPTKADKWLPEVLVSGALARVARQGFMKIEKNAVKKISKIVAG